MKDLVDPEALVNILLSHILWIFAFSHMRNRRVCVKCLTVLDTLRDDPGVELKTNHDADWTMQQKGKKKPLWVSCWNISITKTALHFLLILKNFTSVYWDVMWQSNEKLHEKALVFKMFYK